MKKHSIEGKSLNNFHYVLRIKRTTLFFYFLFFSSLSQAAHIDSEGFAMNSSFVGESEKVTLGVLQQKKRVTGVIRDQTGEAIIGANIMMFYHDHLK